MPIMMSQPYSVPGIASDLRRDETIHQIVDSLECLDKIANEIFTRIHTRVSDNQTKLKQINDRVNLTQAKIDKIKGSSKATKVFATAKYPAQDSTEIYTSVIKSENGLGNVKRPNYKIQSKHKVVDDNVMKSKLQYYNVKGSRKKKSDGAKEEGLGGLPKTVPSVSSLLLFNTTENPYKKYVMLDPLGVITKTRTTLDEEVGGMADAPNTIKTNEEMQRLQTDNYFYVPGIGEVPELDVPVALPNLLGVADDVMYMGEQGSSIAPSVMGGAMPDLPSVLPEVEPMPSVPAIDTGAPAPPPTGPPPPAPPPPPPGAPPAGAPPPPPPPPPPASAPPPPPPSGVPEVVADDGGGGRSSLMDAIRNAGGSGKAKLKNAKEKKQETKKKKKEEASSGGDSGGGDLMGDLFAKLTMRRKGISGTGKPGEGGADKGAGAGSSSGGGTMDKISSMIPAPPKPEGPRGEDGEAEEDWE